MIMSFFSTVLSWYC